jgi:tetratricopeptide (TPR) repeat protein
VQVYETATGRRTHILRGHSDYARGVAFSSDLQRLAAGGDDRTVRLWDLHNGQLIRTLRGHAYGVWDVAFGPDGRWLVSADLSGQVKLWDGRPLTDDLRAEREARALLDWLYAVPSSPPDVPARLRADRTIGPAVRQKALALAPLYAEARVGRDAYRLVEDLAKRPLPREEILEKLRLQKGGDAAVRQKALAYAKHYVEDPGRFYFASWPVVGQSGRSTGEYTRALRLAKIACRLAPDNGSYLTTLGAAYYRTGQWQLALETLTRSERLNAKAYGAPIPADLTFLAMTYHQLGQEDKARSFLKRLREVVQDARWAKDPEAKAFLSEAEGVLAGAQRRRGP